MRRRKPSAAAAKDDLLRRILDAQVPGHRNAAVAGRLDPGRLEADLGELLDIEEVAGAQVGVAPLLIGRDAGRADDAVCARASGLLAGPASRVPSKSVKRPLIALNRSVGRRPGT